MSTSFDDKNWGFVPDVPPRVTFSSHFCVNFYFLGRFIWVDRPPFCGEGGLVGGMPCVTVYRGGVSFGLPAPLCGLCYLGLPAPLWGLCY